jgi:hypothetical protein
MTVAHIVPWCLDCGCPDHAMCEYPGCREMLPPERVKYGRRFCDIHQSVRRRERHRASQARRAALRRKPAPGRPFPFDAIREWLPPDLRSAERGVIEEGWWGHLAAIYCAHNPEVPFRNARQRVGRLRGQYLDAFTADEWAVAVGVHPSEIWSNWYEAIDVDEPEAAVVGGE